MFVEDNKEWITKSKGLLHRFDKKSYLIQKADYFTARDQYKDYVYDPNLIFDHLVSSWDVVFVDGPFGKPHGRCQSIATAGEIKSKDDKTKVFIHDCHRGLEIFYSDHYFEGLEYKGIHHLRMY